jgi:hypothetical protein
MNRILTFGFLRHVFVNILQEPKHAMKTQHDFVLKITSLKERTLEKNFRRKLVLKNGQNCGQKGHTLISN